MKRTELNFPQARAQSSRLKKRSKTARREEIEGNKRKNPRANPTLGSPPDVKKESANMRLPTPCRV